MTFTLFYQEYITDDDILIALRTGQHKAINTPHVLHGCSLCSSQGELRLEIS